MKIKSMWIVAVAILLTAGSAMAQMGGGMPPGGGTMMGGGGAGSGMGGAGTMMSRMYGMTLSRGYLNVLNPITTSAEAVKVINAFIVAAGSKLKLSELWEYETVYKAELADTSGQKAFDLLADKLTGSVVPEMGSSMMLNASWGSALQKTPVFGQKILITPAKATILAQAFVDRNSVVISYASLSTPETYPGYYKFHTTDLSSGKPGIDIMVNGYNGRIWMSTQLGAPISHVPLTP